MGEFQYMLAPIEDMTSNSFRTICYRNGADLTFTELIRVEGLARKNKSTWERIKLNDDTPTVIQLLGAKEDFYKKFLEIFEPPKIGFSGFNLNLGCPSPAVLSLGQGCAMVRRINKTKSIVELFRKKNYPISIKMRLGINQADKDHKAYINLIKEIDADFFVVHARHGKQNYSEPADFDVYDLCVKTGKPIIANGDIKTKKQIEFLKSIGVKGAMIGRAAIVEPTIFNRLKGNNKQSTDKVIEEFVRLSENYYEAPKYSKNILKHFKGFAGYTERQY
jgi:tRNA-dihydrouridine synthase